MAGARQLGGAGLHGHLAAPEPHPALHDPPGGEVRAVAHARLRVPRHLRHLRHDLHPLRAECLLRGQQALVPE